MKNTIIVCTPNLNWIEQASYQSELPGLIKELRKKYGTKRLQIFVRAPLIEKLLKDKKIL